MPSNRSRAGLNHVRLEDAERHGVPVDVQILPEELLKAGTRAEKLSPSAHIKKKSEPGCPVLVFGLNSFHVSVSALVQPAKQAKRT